MKVSYFNTFMQSKMRTYIINNETSLQKLGRKLSSRI